MRPFRFSSYWGFVDADAPEVPQADSACRCGSVWLTELPSNPDSVCLGCGATMVERTTPFALEEFFSPDPILPARLARFRQIYEEACGGAHAMPAMTSLALAQAGAAARGTLRNEEAGLEDWDRDALARHYIATPSSSD